MSVSLIDGHIDDDVMTDEQIIKALEHCVTDLDCLQCPYVDYDGKERCDEKLLNDLCDFINRQKAEKETMQSYIDCLKAEIERLQNILLKFMDEVAKWEAKKGIDVSELPLIPICDEGRDIIDHYRARAIKEFAERLKAHTRKMSSSDFSGEFWDKAVLVSDIDNLVKEMVGAESG